MRPWRLCSQRCALSDDWLDRKGRLGTLGNTVRQTVTHQQEAGAVRAVGGEEGRREGVRKGHSLTNLNGRPGARAPSRPQLAPFPFPLLPSPRNHTWARGRAQPPAAPQRAHGPAGQRCPQQPCPPPQPQAGPAAQRAAPWMPIPWLLFIKSL